MDEEGYRLIIGMFFIPGGASPKAGLKDTEGVFRKGGQGGPLNSNDSYRFALKWSTNSS